MHPPQQLTTSLISQINQSVSECEQFSPLRRRHRTSAQPGRQGMRRLIGRAHQVRHKTLLPILQPRAPTTGLACPSDESKRTVMDSGGAIK
jgi:hypothetical protein